MSKKLKIFLCVLGVTIGVCVCAGIVVLMLHGRNVGVQTVPSEYVESSSEETEEFVPMGPQYEDVETAVEDESLVYNDDVLNSPIELGGVIFFCGLYDFIQIDKFSEVLLGEYDSVRVLRYNGGRRGVFDVMVETDVETYDGVWDDASGVWYENREEYSVE